jgi:hypothetical protein
MKRRRNKHGSETVIDSLSFKTFYYSPTDIQELFEDHYKSILVKPIGLFVPPSYLEPYVKKRVQILNIFIFLDKLVSRFSFFANMSDHYMIILEKK